MRVELTGRHLIISPGLRNLVNRKLMKVQRVLNDAGVSAAVVVFKEKVNNVVEITLHTRGEQFLHAVAKASTWEAAMTDVVAKVMHQTEAVKNRWKERKRRGEAARSVKTPKAVKRARRAAAVPAGPDVAADRRPAAPVARKRATSARAAVARARR
jgi:ribosomal subunit interface protein